MFYDLVLAFYVSCVVCLQSKQWIILFCVCVVCFFFGNKTKWFSCLHLVDLFPFCCFVLNFVFHFSQAKTQKKKNTTKTKQMLNNNKTNAEQKQNKCWKKGHILQFVQLCSQIVFLFFGGVWAKKRSFYWKHYKVVVSASLKRENGPKNVKKVEWKLGPRLCQNLVQICCAT